MMQIRRNMMGVIAQMAQGESLPVGWHKLELTNSSAITLGGELATFCSNNIPSCFIATGIVLNDYSDTAPESGSPYTFVWLGDGSSSRFFRYNNGVPNGDGRQLTNTYACKIPQGTKIIVYYHDSLTE